tara:strand:- start:1689 stop:1847 length:159 start_codon:yes stop_codon:yes gene_type:complete
LVIIWIKYYFLKKRKRKETDVNYAVANVIAQMFYTITSLMVIFVLAIPVGTK